MGPSSVPPCLLVLQLQKKEVFWVPCPGAIDIAHSLLTAHTAQKIEWSQPVVLAEY